ncbi:hypothetical protein MBT84_28325 [Streptomyces sp. MBT84]|nr:hypothetical protein [Streptomyces sp. MBT84]
MDGDHIAVLGARGRRRTGLATAGGGAGQLARVPEVSDTADGHQGEDHDEGDDPAARAAPGLLTALGAVLGELQPVDDVFGVAVGLLDEGELVGGVVAVTARFPLRGDFRAPGAPPGPRSGVPGGRPGPFPAGPVCCGM